MSPCASSALLSIPVFAHSCVMPPFHLDSVSLPGSTWTLSGPLDSTWCSSGGSSAIPGRRSSLPSSSGLSWMTLGALDSLVSTSPTLAPSTSSGELSGELSGFVGRRVSTTTSPVLPVRSLDASNTLALPLHPLLPSGKLGGSVCASGQRSSSPVVSAGSSDSLGGFLVTASLPGWLRNTLDVLALVFVG